MRDDPPDYLKTISTIEPLGSHRLAEWIQRKGPSSRGSLGWEAQFEQDVAEGKLDE